MNSDPSFHDYVTQRQITDLVMRRVAEHVYDRPLINNVERADYVECLVELIMQSADPRWRLTETWDAWDVEHTGTGVRIEVKQSSALQIWSGQSPTKTNPRFDISIREWDWLRCTHGEYHSFRSAGLRSADVYVFAWHGKSDRELADHRKASQWEFFVVPETELPADQQSIGLNPLRGLVQPCTYRSLADRVTEAIPDDSSRLKASLVRAPDPCGVCRPA
ncbi:MAG: hypothetical protein OXD34_11735 [bacterium]|nr:hypothetical protein [bacterium]